MAEAHGKDPTKTAEKPAGKGDRPVDDSDREDETVSF